MIIVTILFLFGGIIVNFSYKFPAVKGVQAGREYYVVMVPLKFLSKLFVTDPEYVSPEYRAQRRLNESRIPTIKNYILNNRNNYVFSALSASIDGEFSFVPYKNGEDIGILEIDMENTFLINDGQHRKAAIEEALKDDPSLGDETISVVFFEDKGLERSQQMFTDLNKHAVRTSNSLSTLYDSRDEFAVITKQVIAEIPFFQKYTDKEKDNLGKNSSKIFTLTNIYKANKNILHGSIQDGDKEFLVDFWTNVVNNIIEWQELLDKELSKADLKRSYILCLNITLLALGRIGNYYYLHREIDMSSQLKALRKIDWSRDNRLDWNGRAVRDNGKVNTGEKAVILIANRIKVLMGIPLTDAEIKSENSLKK